MKVNKGKKKDGKIKIEAAASAEDVNKAFTLAEIDFANSMGFTAQEGKSIAEMAKEKMGITNLDSIVEKTAFEILIPMAIDKAGVIPAFPPEVEARPSLKRGQGVSFEAEVTLKPSYELTSYDPVEIVMPPFTINEAEIDAQLEQFADRGTTYENIEDRPLEKGDACLISIKCIEDGKELTGLTTDARTYVSGEGFMPSEFDDKIEGMVPGETREFTFEAPSFDEEYNPVMKQIECTATLKAIQKANPPIIDDAWVKANMPMYKNLEELRKDIRTKIEQRDREQYDNYKMQMAVNALTDRFEGAIADEIYMNARDNLLQQIHMELKQQGKTWDEFVQENGGEQQVNMMLMLQVRETIVRGFVLDAIYRHEGLSITDADIDAVCHAMNPQVSPKLIREQIEGAGQGFVLRESAERMVANKWIAEHAKVTIQGE